MRPICPSCRQYSIPTNYFAYNSRGVEFDIDFGRINSIRTSFGLNGSWTQYKSWKNYYTFTNHTTGSSVAGSYPHMGVFEPGNKAEHSSSNTTNDTECVSRTTFRESVSSSR